MNIDRGYILKQCLFYCLKQRKRFNAKLMGRNSYALRWTQPTADEYSQVEQNSSEGWAQSALRGSGMLGTANS
jgi:hypothetical protein